ncbi:hypothetical protein EZS27_001877 [termite gut metagenome]|uniref:DUF4959 domain-containing protein n=1 Tax=termite gut metagenome TaxID=433724 RepID=A0A5J4SZH4_9ZZZZ
MKNNCLYIVLAMILYLGLYACGDADVNDPRGSTAIPAQVTNVRVKNLGGSAVIFYDRPNDKNLKYIQAAYTLEDETERTFNASFYTDSVLVNGFPEAGEYEVKLYSVSYGETKSEPVTVLIHPTTPAYKVVLERGSIEATFGGLRFTSVDEAASDLSIIFLREDPDGWQEVGAYYTNKMVNLQHVIRKQQPVETRYAAYAGDRWGHKSDTIYATIIPWEEIEIPKGGWRAYRLPDDNYTLHSWSGSDVTLEKMWDGSVTNWNALFHSKTTDPIPQWFTFHLGKPYVFSRLVMNMRWDGGTNYTNFFTATSGMPKTFEVWATNEPDPLGGFDSWTRLESFNVLRADGTMRTHEEAARTQADLDMIRPGHNFDFPAGLPPYQYVRINILSTYGVNSVQIEELTFFGQNAQAE